MSVFSNIKEDYHLEGKLDMRYNDRIFWLFLFMLVGASVLSIFSANYSAGIGYLAKQILIVGIGLGMAFIIQLMPTWMIRSLGYLLCIGSFIALCLMPFLPKKMVLEVDGTIRWIRLLGFTLQPSEFVKPGLVIVVSDLLRRIQTGEDERRYFWWTLGITGLVCVPIIPNNLSTCILICVITFLMWIVGRVSIRYWGTTALVAILLLVGGYLFVENVYVKQNRSIERGPMKRAMKWVKRVDTFIADKDTKDTADPYAVNDDNRQARYGQMAVARGRFFGVFPGNGRMHTILSESDSDFIFAVIVEETGLLGILYLMICYLSTLFRACWTSSRYEDNGAMLMVMGLAILLSAQALISMMVSVGLGPVTGQPLPMISHGGSSALATCIIYGVIMAVSREQAMLADKQRISREKNMEEIQIDIEE